ncbi:MAG: hypothetical protein WCG30_01950 [Candidatus Saccharibacteria bacterium]
MKIAKIIFILSSVLLLIIGLSFLFGQKKSSKNNSSSKKNTMGLSSQQLALCQYNNVPINSCKKAINTKYYCPSWDAKPGTMTSSICKNLSNPSQKPLTIK